MPRKRSKNDGPALTRSRNGCQTCRDRHLKCDETRPICLQCQMKKLECKILRVQLRWEEEMVEKGLTFGREGVWTKSKSGRRVRVPTRVTDSEMRGTGVRYADYYFINNTVHDFTEISSATACDEDGNGSTFGSIASLASRMTGAFDPAALPVLLAPAGFSSPSVCGDGRFSPSPLSPLLQGQNVPALSPLLHPIQFDHTFSQTDSHLLNYYISSLCPLTSLTSSSPFQTLIIPLALLSGSSHMMHSLLGLAASHLARIEGGNTGWKEKALKHKGLAVVGLRKRLSEGGEQAVVEGESLVTMMMMCLSEIASDCDAKWVVHLRGAKQVIALRRQLLAARRRSSSTLITNLDFDDPVVVEEGNPVIDFAHKFFAFQDVIGRTACGEVPLFTTEHWRKPGVDNADDLTTIDPWMGCSRELVSILSEITELTRWKAQSSATPNTIAHPLLSRTQDLELRLSTLHQHPPTFTAPSEIPTLLLAAELKRLAAVVFLNCALRDAAPSTPQIRPYIHEILSGVQLLIERGTYAGLIWPVFVAAVELDPLEDFFSPTKSSSIPISDGLSDIGGRRFVLKVFAEMERHTLANVARARGIVKRVWKARDMELDETGTTARRNAERRGNDWERFVAPISGNISLA
ncbi:hypothetical protein YB2330_000836 [Saitoella coloradoensis]